MGNAPGMSQDAMNRMLSSQGVNQNVVGDQRSYAAGADQAFGNLFNYSAANENQMQQNRLGNVQMDANQTQRALDMAKLGGMTGIGMQRGQAEQQWKQLQEERAYNDWGSQQAALQQEAMQNWNRQNTVGDQNVSNTNAWRQSVMDQILGLIPSMGANPLPSWMTLNQ
jgi:hypothetical protein